MREYTQHEDEFIRESWRRMTDREIGDALGRSETAVGSHRSKIGLLRAETGKKDPGMRPWSAGDDTALRRIFAAGAGDEDMAIALGRTVGAVAQRRSSLGLLRMPQPDSLRQRVWTDEEDLVLGWMFRRDWTDEKIGREMGKTAVSIKDRRQSLGLWRVPRE